MKLPINLFKQKLTGKRPLFGLWQGITDTACAEIGAGAGFDWLLIDAEHAPFDVKTAMSHLQAIAVYDVPAIVRPVCGDTALIKQLLDIGAQTLLIPMVDNAQQAEQLVQAVYYPPKGIRGMGTSMARAANWNRIGNYAHCANDEICLIAQAETTTAIENLADIVAVDGIDAVFIGPSDLSASMGYVGNPTHPEVLKTIHQAFTTINNAGKYAGVLAVDKSLVDNYIEAGAKFVGVGVDIALLAQSTQKLVAQYIDSDNKTLAGY